MYVFIHNALKNGLLKYQSMNDRWMPPSNKFGQLEPEHPTILLGLSRSKQTDDDDEQERGQYRSYGIYQVSDLTTLRNNQQTNQSVNTQHGLETNRRTNKQTIKQTNRKKFPHPKGRDSTVVT